MNITMTAEDQLAPLSFSQKRYYRLMEFTEQYSGLKGDQLRDIMPDYDYFKLHHNVCK